MSGDVRQAGITSRPTTSPLSVFGPDPRPASSPVNAPPANSPTFQQEDQLSLSSRSPSVPVARSVSLVSSATEVRAEGPAAPKDPPEKKGFFATLMGILKAIVDLLLAPFRFLMGLLGIGSSGNRDSAGPKLTAAEKLNGRPVTQTQSQTPDTGKFGPFPLQTKTIQLPTWNGKTTPADVYYPAGKGPFPVVLHSYGLASNKENHAGTASHYASWGMVVIVPRLPEGGDSPSENAKDLAHWVQWLQKSPPEMPAALALERGVGLSGHSFGGLSSVLAGSTPGVGAVVALDPADAWGKGKEAAPQLNVPSAFIVGEPSMVNQFGNGLDIYEQAGGEKQAIRVKGARHTDFENSHNDGAKNAANQTAMRFAVGFMLHQLTGAPEYAAYAKGGKEVQAETGKSISLPRG